MMAPSPKNSKHSSKHGSKHSGSYSGRRTIDRRWCVVISTVVINVVVMALAINFTVHKTGTTQTGELTMAGATEAGAEFAHATVGSCLNWDDNSSDTQIDSLKKVHCDKPHRFEVAGIVDLTTYPSQRFATGEEPLSPAQVDSLRLGLCRPFINSYLPQGLDPAGRFRIGILQPGAESWKRGVRTLVCGIEASPSVSLSANPEFTGTVAKQDQSLIWATGSCLASHLQHPHDVQEVDCRKPHTMEIVGTVDLTPQFGKHYPSAKQQNVYAEKQCVALANTYLGGAEKLRDTTLTVLWSRVSLAGWNAGSHRVTCSLAQGNKTGFATLQGSATGSFTIDGKKPKKPKKLPPKGNNQLPDMHNDPLLKYSVPGLSY